MRFRRISLSSKPSSHLPARVSGDLRGTRRAVVVAGVAALIVVSLAAAAIAAVRSAATTEPPRHPAPAAAAAAQRASAVHRTTAARAASHHRATAASRGPAARRPSATRSGQTAMRATAMKRTGAGLRTSCTTVGHIGDSTSVGMVSATWLPDAAQRLSAQYADVGVRHLWVDASGGRSIVEEMPGQLNGQIVAQKWRAAGFHGCWVFALGTNDTANVSVGSNVGRMARIQEMMAVAHGEPVVWVNAQTDLTGGPWSEANMQLWNAALLQSCHAYPNMRVLNWAGQVQPAWHLPDGIHYTSAGYAIRAHAIARGLAGAFAQNGRSKGCVVG
jgi:hypothetical protein